MPNTSTTRLAVRPSDVCIVHESCNGARPDCKDSSGCRPGTGRGVSEVEPVKITTAQRRALTKAAAHKEGHVVGADPRVTAALLDRKLVEVYGHFYGALYRITDAGREALS